MSEELIRTAASAENLQIKSENSGVHGSRVERLPIDILNSVLTYCSVHDLCNVSQVNNNFNEISRSDFIWRPIVTSFLNENTSTALMTETLRSNFKLFLKRRIADPNIGDRLESAWFGRLVMGHNIKDKFGGKTWWSATVIGKKVEETCQMYMVSYKGWHSRWDEWVDRSKLRWINFQIYNNRIYPGNKVEVRIISRNLQLCPENFWFESVVIDVNDDNIYTVERSSSEFVRKFGDENALLEPLFIDDSMIRRRTNLKS
jgi:hypothetical protein